jgi:hypothetical protein
VCRYTVVTQLLFGGRCPTRLVTWRGDDLQRLFRIVDIPDADLAVIGTRDNSLRASMNGD